MSKVKVIFEIEAGRLKDLETFLNGGTGATKGRPKKATEEDDVDFLGGDGEEEPDFLSEDTEEPELNIDTIRTEVKARVDAKKGAMLDKLFAKYKAKNLSTLKKDKYEAFYNDLQKIKV